MPNNNYNFQKLTPVKNVELGIYENAINFIFDNNDVKNIAITGQYGAGKSSLLESYKETYQDKKFIHISLAHFTPIGDTETSETALEGKILNQLIHQIPSENIPQTNFKIKKRVNKRDILSITTLLTLFIFLLFHLIFFKNWTQYVQSLPLSYIKSVLEISTQPSFLLMTSTYSLILFGIFLYHLVTIQKNRNIFRKIKVQGNEIDIFEESKDSYFDKYLNEVLYLFENTDADVVVFEDIDRFDTNTIFERLREVNTLVNNQLKQSSKEPLRFFYLLRDDLFTSKERAKFFDFILPVIPVVDSSNAYDQFISHFKESKLLDKFQPRFLQGLSLYIDDMRILKNIYNEFIVYYNKLNTTELDYNKMLAIITYKNIFPRDFSDLQLNKGMVFTLFDQKNTMIEKSLLELQQKKDAIKEKIEKEDEKNTLLIKEQIDAQQRKLVAKFSGYHRDNIDESFDQWKKELIQKINKIDELSGQLKNVEKEIQQIFARNLNEILNKNNIDELFKSLTHTNELDKKNTFDEIKESEYFDLLKYLIRNGYIDESYPDYMTYFYGNSLKQSDKIFLRSITDRKAKEYTYALVDIPLIITRLRSLDFEEAEILNFDLFSFLLTKHRTHSTYLTAFLDYLMNEQELEFIIEYFETKRETAIFIEKLNTHWPEIFEKLQSTTAFSDDQIKLYSICTLYYSKNLQELDSNHDLSEYISLHDEYLNIEKPNIDSIVKGLKLLRIEFKAINYETANKNLLKAIYQNNLYELNAKNIVLMLEKIYQQENMENINQKNYTMIMSKPEFPLANYVNANINKYINVVFELCNNEIHDDEMPAISIINNEDISDDNKDKYIALLKTPITSISKVENKDFWSALLETKKVVYSAENIIDYFVKSNNKINNTLIAFINSGTQALDFSQCDTEIVTSLFMEIINCPDVENNKYREILSSQHRLYQYTNDHPFGIADIQPEKLKILIDLGIILMNLNSLEFIRSHYNSSLLYYYIRHNLEEYQQITAQGAYKHDEIIELLSWEDISDEIKIEFLKLVKEPISIYGKSYSVTVNIFILENLFNQEELIKLSAEYIELDKTIQPYLLDHIAKNINNLIQSSFKIKYMLLTDLLSLNDEILSATHKVDLFVFVLGKLDKEQRVKCLSIMGLTEYESIFDLRHNNEITISDNNKKLLKALKEQELIKDYIQQPESNIFNITKHRKSDQDNEITD